MKTRPDKVFKLKMDSNVAEYTRDKAAVTLVLPMTFKVGDRLWMVECAASGRTGRADLCTITSVSGNLLVLHRGMCWRKQKFDDDLSELSLTLQPDEFKMIDGSAIPGQEE